jgi:DNA polymerase delta subunit 1
MGIVLKRRDNAKIVKKICGSILHIMFTEEKYAEKCKVFVRNIMLEMFKNKFDISYFTITKTLRSNYKGKKLTDLKYKCNCSSIQNETVSEKSFHKKSCKSIANIGDKGSWRWDDCQCSIAHVTLCQRMKKRDIGSAPNANDRISYVYIVNKQKNILQADRIEELSYVIKKKLEIDYQFYIDNQIKNPSVQFLELFITNPEYLFSSVTEKLNTAKQLKITSFF